MEKTAKLCEECIEYVKGNCDGKEQATVKGGKLPCKKYRFATDELIGNLDYDEPVDEPTNSQLNAVLVDSLAEPVDVMPTDEQLNKSLAVLGSVVKTKTYGSKPLAEKQASFQKLSAARCNKAIAAIKLLGNLNNRYAYDYADADVKALRIMLENVLDETFSQFGGSQSN